MSAAEDILNIGRAKRAEAKPPPAPPAPTFAMVKFGDFVRDHKPPPYLIKKMFQKGYLYSLTAPTSVGKTAVATLLADFVSSGSEFHEHAVRKERVLYFAGENPDDIRSRFVRIAENRGAAPDDIAIVFVPRIISFADKAQRIELQRYAEEHGPFGLVVVDTSMAYFPGDNENDNVQMMLHARSFRSLLDLPGNPMVLVLCHPAGGNNADKSVPRGGTAFMNEFDGNAYLTRLDSVVTMHRHSKFRGRPWDPVSFEVRTEFSGLLVDEDGDKIPTVVARPISDAEEMAKGSQSRTRFNMLLLQMVETPEMSQVDLAKSLGWLNKQGKPQKMAVKRAMDHLVASGKVRLDGGVYHVTKAGATEANRLKKTGLSLERQVDFLDEEPAEDGEPTAEEKRTKRAKEAIG